MRSIMPLFCVLDVECKLFADIYSKSVDLQSAFQSVRRSNGHATAVAARNTRAFIYNALILNAPQANHTLKSFSAPANGYFWQTSASPATATMRSGAAFCRFAGERQLSQFGSQKLPAQSDTAERKANDRFWR